MARSPSHGGHGGGGDEAHGPRAGATRLGVVGAGEQDETQVLNLAALMKPARIVAADQSAAALETFAARLGEVRMDVTTDVERAVRESDVIRLATTSRVPILKAAPEATAEVFLPDGWFATGDIGSIDSQGFLYITAARIHHGRKKDLTVTGGGINIAPQNIENLLKGDPFISQAMVHGDRRPYPVALITLNPDELGKFARQQGILVTDPAALAKHPKVIERVWRIIEERNVGLQSYEKIKKFTILPEDFTVDNGLLTSTLKVKRKVITDKHRELLDSLYA